MSEPASVLLEALRKQTIALQLAATSLLDVLSLVEFQTPEEWTESQQPVGFVPETPS